MVHKRIADDWWKGNIAEAGWQDKRECLLVGYGQLKSQSVPHADDTVGKERQEIELMMTRIMTIAYYRFTGRYIIKDYD